MLDDGDGGEPPVGTYPITASGAADPNYTISYVAGTLTVTPAVLTVTAANETKAYGAANPTLTVSYSGFVNGDTAASLTTPPTCRRPRRRRAARSGTYPITAQRRGEPANYTITFVAGTLTVTPAALSVTADNETKAYGAANPTLTVSYSGFVNGDTAASLTTPADVLDDRDGGERGRDLSDYGERGGRAANYTISYVTGTLTVTAAALTVTAAADEGLRGGEPGVDGELQRLRQRRHGGQPDHRADVLHDGDRAAARSGPIRSRRAVRRARTTRSAT